jgi:hypothetical protein
VQLRTDRQSHQNVASEENALPIMSLIFTKEGNSSRECVRPREELSALPAQAESKT